jgi:hypothetical protein
MDALRKCIDLLEFTTVLHALHLQCMQSTFGFTCPKCTKLLELVLGHA